MIIFYADILGKFDRWICSFTPGAITVADVSKSVFLLVSFRRTIIKLNEENITYFIIIPQHRRIKLFNVSTSTVRHIITSNSRSKQKESDHMIAWFSPLLESKNCKKKLD